MNNNLLTRLAFTGLKNNKKTVIPYIALCSVTITVFHILLSLVNSKFLIQNGNPAFYGADFLRFCMTIGCIAVGIFAVIFVFYGNSFVMKGRRKEIGLYGVLGLSKKNVTFVMLIESLVQSTCSIGGGIFAGAFLNKISVLFLFKIVKQPFVKGLDFSLKATLITLVFFMVIFAVCLIYNILTVNMANPISVLKSENVGEKEPKVKIILLIIGVVAITYGYYMALTAKSTLVAMTSLFKAIVLVSVGTYALFISGSIFVLKMLKKNKDYYYKTKHFISVSNLMFRMKHNAAGLASICILSTGVILLLVCTSSLMMLGEQNIDIMYPHDVAISPASDDGLSLEEVGKSVDEALDKSGIEAENRIGRRYSISFGEITEKGVEPDCFPREDLSNTCCLYIVTLDDYYLYTGEKETLSPGEILRYSTDNKVKEGENFSIFGTEFYVKKSIDGNVIGDDDSYANFCDVEYIVIANEAEKDLIIQNNPDVPQLSNTLTISFDVDEKTTDEQIQILKDEINGKYGFSTFSYKNEERELFYSLYGGVFFVGIFLTILFLIATVMLIFYKQMSEGMEDKKRFEILSNAGLSDKEARGVIKSQVMLMFFLPVCTAIVHMMFASKILKLFMGMILYVKMSTFCCAIAIVCLVFLLIYTLVYRITSKQYYNIVYGENKYNESVKENRESFVGNYSYGECGSGNRA